MVKRSIEQNLRIKNSWIQKRKLWDKRRGQESGDKTAWTKNSWRLLAVESQRAVFKGDNCSFRHDINKRAKTTQPNLSPSSSTRQNERNASRSTSPRGKSPSRRMFRLFCKDYFKGHQFILWKMASSRMLVLQVREWMQIWVKSALTRIARLKNRQAKGLKKWWQKCSDYAEKYTTIGLRISGYGAAEVFIDFAEELQHTETNPMCLIHKRRRTSC